MVMQARIDDARTNGTDLDLVKIGRNLSHLLPAPDLMAAAAVCGRLRM
jgi:hypothetical protein